MIMLAGLDIAATMVAAPAWCCRYSNRTILLLHRNRAPRFPCFIVLHQQSHDSGAADPALHHHRAGPALHHAGAAIALPMVSASVGREGD